IYDTSNSGILWNDLIAIGFDRNHELWITCEMGVSHFDGTNWINYLNNIGGGNDINGEAISIAFDLNNTAWVGQQRPSGLQIFNGTNWIDVNRCEIGMCSNEVFAATKDLNGNLWVMNHQTLNRYDGNNWVRFDSLVGYGGSSILVDADNHIWIANGKVYEYDGNNWIQHPISHAFDINGMGSNIAVDSQGNIWQCGGEGINKFDGTAWVNFNVVDGKDICVDNNNHIWVTS